MPGRILTLTDTDSVIALSTIRKALYVMQAIDHTGVFRFGCVGCIGAVISTSLIRPCHGWARTFIKTVKFGTTRQSVSFQECRREASH